MTMVIFPAYEYMYLG